VEKKLEGEGVDIRVNSVDWRVFFVRDDCFKAEVAKLGTFAKKVILLTYQQPKIYSFWEIFIVTNQNYYKIYLRKQFICLILKEIKMMYCNTQN